MQKTKNVKHLVYLLLVVVALSGSMIAQADGNTISKAEAYRLARAFIPASFVPRGTLDEYKDADAQLRKSNDGTRYWYVDFVRPWNDQDEEVVSIFVLLSSDGEQLLNLGTSWRKDHDIMQKLDHLIREKGMFVLWTPEDKLHFREEWTKKVNELPPDTLGEGNYLLRLLSKKYILPTERDLPETKAVEMALQTLAQEIDIEQFTVAKSFIEDDAGNHFWQIFLIPKNPMDFGYRVDIQSPDGKIIHTVNYADDSTFGFYGYE